MSTVVLYGNSLALSSIGASLAGLEGMHTVPIDATLPDAASRPHDLGADVVVFDAATIHPDALALWQTDPDLLLVGVDLASDMALVLSGACTRVWTTNDLVAIIQRHAPVHRSHP